MTSELASWAHCSTRSSSGSTMPRSIYSTEPTWAVSATSESIWDSGRKIIGSEARMRWKWKLGLLLVVAMESPILAWGGLFLHLPAEGVGYLAAILTALLFGMLVLRPTLFALAGLWLVGIAASGLYFMRYLRPTLALGLGSIPPTLAR